MKTRLLITSALILALVTIPIQPARPMMALPPPPKPHLETLVECVVVVVVLVVAGTIVYGLYKMCKKLDGLNHGTNNVAANPDLTARGQGDSTTFSVQSSESADSGFSETVRFTVNQSGWQVSAVALTNGVPVLTNTATMTVTNGIGYVTLDFSALNLPAPTPQCRFFRVAQ